MSGQSAVHIQKLGICQYLFCTGSTVTNSYVPLDVGHSRVLSQVLGMSSAQICFAGEPVSQGPTYMVRRLMVFKDEGQSPAT